MFNILYHVFCETGLPVILCLVGAVIWFLISMEDI